MYAIKILNMNKSRYKKLDKLEYVELKTRNYLIAKNLNLDQKRLIFKYRTRTADYGENFRAGREMVICPLCQIHLDSQFLCLECPVIKKEVKEAHQIEDIYSDQISLKTVEVLQRIEAIRRGKLRS